jgi:hypothetical protein
MMKLEPAHGTEDSSISDEPVDALVFVTTSSVVTEGVKIVGAVDSA